MGENRIKSHGCRAHHSEGLINGARGYHLGVQMPKMQASSDGEHGRMLGDGKRVHDPYPELRPLNRPSESIFINPLPAPCGGKNKKVCDLLICLYCLKGNIYEENSPS